MRRLLTLFALFLALLIPAESVAGPFMVLHKRGSAWSKAWLTGWDYRKEFTVSRASGAVTDYQVRLLIGKTGGYVISSCEDATGWSAKRSTLATDTGHEGTNAITITATSDDGYAYLSFSESDWRDTRNIVFWHKRSGTAETTGEVYIFDANDDYVSWNFSMSDDWTEQVIDTTSTPDSSSGTMDWDRIVKMRFDANAEGTVLYVDYINRKTVDCEGHCLSTFNDLRFTNSDGDLLSYYIESITGTTPNQIATVWVKLDSVGTSATKFYMYYGNSGASAASNGANTFILFEDFNALTDGDLNGQNSWSGSANFDVQTSVKYEGAKALEITTGGSTINIKKAVSVTSYNCFVQAMMRSNDVSQANILAIYANEGAHGISAIYLGQNRFNHFVAAGWQTTNIGASNNTWFKARLAFDSASTHKVWINDALATPAANTNNTNVTSAIDSIMIEQYTDTTATGYIDTIFVGQYLSTGPTLGAFGAEESK